MADIAGPYSAFKIIHHPERIAQLKRGEQIVPTQVQLILASFCTHSCKFCLPFSTTIETPKGKRYIGELAIGDQVLTPFGGTGTITEVGNRVVDTLVHVSAGSWQLSCTEDHPILTENGYVDAGNLKDGDKIAVVLEIGTIFTREVDTVRLVHEECTVYNITVSPFEAYIANGVIVHNCAYRWEGYLSNEMFTKGAELSQFGANNPIRYMPYEKAVEVIDDCAEMGVGAVQFSVWGEERIPVVDADGNMRTVPIGEFVDSLFGCNSDGRHEERDVSSYGYKTFAIDDDGRLILDDLTHVYRHAATEPLYEVVLEGGSRACVTASHSLNAIVNGKIEKVPVSQLNVGDQIACADWNKHFDEIAEDNREFCMPQAISASAAKDIIEVVQESPELYRLLGYYTAEGSSVSRSLVWVFGNGPRENDYRDDTLRCIKSVFGIDGRPADRRVYLDSVRAQSLFEQTFAAGEVQSKRSVPKIVWQASRINQMEYLRGLFSGDGNYRSSKTSHGHYRNSLHLKTCNRNLALEVTTLIRQIGANASVGKGTSPKRMIEGRWLEPSDYYTVNIYDSTSLQTLQPILDGLKATPKYCNSVYSSCGSKKKPCVFGVDARAVKIKEIRLCEELGRPVVYDVTVRKTHRFLLSSGIGCANTGGGEPTAHPQHVELMKYSLDKGLDGALVSHGEIFKTGHIENLLRFKWVRFSLDAGLPETYGSIRSIHPKRMNKVLKNISDLVQARKEFIAAGNPCDLIIGIGFVVTKDNWKEIVIGANLAKSLGVDNFRISAVFQPDNEQYFTDFYEEAKALCKEAVAIGDSTFRVFDNFGERVQDLVQRAPDEPFCGYQQFVTYIADSLDVFRCCVLAFNSRGLIGSIKDQRFKELWESEQKRLDFENFDATKCTHCMFNQRLQTINYAIADKPQHANFV